MQSTMQRFLNGCHMHFLVSWVQQLHPSCWIKPKHKRSTIKSWFFSTRNHTGAVHEAFHLRLWWTKTICCRPLVDQNCMFCFFRFPTAFMFIFSVFRPFHDPLDKFPKCLPVLLTTSSLLQPGLKLFTALC